MEHVRGVLGSPSILFGKRVECIFFPTNGEVVSCPGCKEYIKTGMAIIRNKDTEGNPVMFHLNCFAKERNKSVSTT